MARSAEVAYPRSQLSVYRTIGPLVYLGDAVYEKQRLDHVMATYFRIESNKEDQDITIAVVWDVKQQIKQTLQQNKAFPKPQL